METEIWVIMAGCLFFVLREISHFLEHQKDKIHEEVDEIAVKALCEDEEDTCRYLSFDEGSGEWMCRKCKRFLK